MADPRVIAQNVGVTEKDLMLKAIMDLQNEVRSLSATISQQIGAQRKNDEFQSIVKDTLRKNNKQTVEEVAKAVLEKFKESRQSEREETQAQIRSSFMVFEEKMKHPFRNAASSALSGMANMVDDKRTGINHAAESQKRFDDGLKSILNSASKLLIPEKVSENKEDSGHTNKNFGPNKPIASSVESKNLIGVLNKYKEQNKLDSENSKLVNEVISQLEKDVQTDKKAANIAKARKTVKELAEEKAQSEYDRMNAEKNEALATEEAKSLVFKEKMKHPFRNAASSAFSGMANMVDDKETGINHAARSQAKFDSMLSGGLKLLSKRFQPDMPSPQEKDSGHDNPNFGPGKGLKTSATVAGSRTKVNAKEKSSPFESAVSAATGSSSSNVIGLLQDINETVGETDSFMRNRLKDDILEGIAEMMEKQGADQAQPQGSQEQSTDDEEGEEDEKGGGNKISKARRLGRLARRGGSMLMRGLRFLGNGSAMGGAAAIALGAATAYTVYETYKTAQHISAAKEGVRDLSTGVSQNASKVNKEKYTDDNPEVKSRVPMYEKAGLSNKEAVSSAKADRNANKLVSSAASMESIFNSAQHSTDFRSSQEEVDSLAMGQATSEALRKIAQGIMAKVGDVNAVKNLKPHEIASIQKTAGTALKQIDELKGNWENSKKLAQKGFLHSPWIQDEKMVGAGDEVVNSLVESGKDIQEAFDVWSKDMADGSKNREKGEQNKKPEKKQEQKPEEPKVEPPKQSDKAKERQARFDKMKAEGKLTGDPDIDASMMQMQEAQDKLNSESSPNSADLGQQRTGDDLDEALRTGIMKPPPGFRETTDADRKSIAALRTNVEKIDSNTSPTNKNQLAKVSNEIKETVGQQNEAVVKKLDDISKQLVAIAEKKPVLPPPSIIKSDNSFTQMSNMSKGI